MKWVLAIDLVIVLTSGTLFTLISHPVEALSLSKTLTPTSRLKRTSDTQSNIYGRSTTELSNTLYNTLFGEIINGKSLLNSITLITYIEAFT